MGTRGRRSLEDTLLVPERTTALAQYADAPYELADEEAEEWRSIIKARPHDHFSRDNFPLLVQLCRHIVQARRVAELLRACIAAKDFDRKEYSRLLKLQAAESDAIMRLATKMRLTQQAFIDPQSIKLRIKTTEKNPWDRNEG